MKIMSCDFDITKEKNEKLIDVFKQKMVDELKKINAPSDTYFVLGSLVNKLLDSVYTIGRLDEAQERRECDDNK